MVSKSNQKVVVSQEGSTRHARGILIETQRKIFHVRQTNRYWVQSQRDSNKFYDVAVNESGFECNCPDWKNHPDSICKHGYAVMMKEIRA